MHHAMPDSSQLRPAKSPTISSPTACAARSGGHPCVSSAEFPVARSQPDFPCPRRCPPPARYLACTPRRLGKHRRTSAKTTLCSPRTRLSPLIVDLRAVVSPKSQTFLFSCFLTFFTSLLLTSLLRFSAPPSGSGHVPALLTRLTLPGHHFNSQPPAYPLRTLKHTTCAAASFP